jgi:hypothetical protein
MLHFSAGAEPLKSHPDVTACRRWINFDNFGNRNPLLEIKFLGLIDLMTTLLRVFSATIFE